MDVEAGATHFGTGAMHVEAGAMHDGTRATHVRTCDGPADQRHHARTAFASARIVLLSAVRNG